jgi:hypothetical protein
MGHAKWKRGSNQKSHEQNIHFAFEELEDGVIGMQLQRLSVSAYLITYEHMLVCTASKI